MHFRQFLCICLLWFACTIVATAQAVTRIAFGSCNNQYKPQPLWQEIIKNKPDLWVWLGDNIYADTEDMQKMEKDYSHQLQRSEYKQLLQTCPVTGIWSDHDYNNENADKHFRFKKQSQQLFLDFMGISKQDHIREQEGIYRSYILGEGNQKVKIILLDDLYHRDSFKKLFRLFLPEPEGDILGPAQWAWLEKELTDSDAMVHIIATSLQVLPTSYAYSNWSAFPEARNRLLQLLEKTKPTVPIILSGDRHVGELSKTELAGYSYPVYEITSSGMTHHRRAKKGGNKYRVGEQVGALNFGLLEINWHENYTSVTLKINGVGNKIYLQKTVTYPVT